MCASLVTHLGLPVILAPEEEPVRQSSGDLHAQSKLRDTQLRTLWSSVLIDRCVELMTLSVQETSAS